MMGFAPWDGWKIAVIVAICTIAVVLGLVLS